MRLATVTPSAPPAPPRLAADAVQWWGRQPYAVALERQRALHAAVVAGDAPDTLVLLEHDAVYTAGRRTVDADRPRASRLPVIDVDRGGMLTWHGPGQLVGYPIVRLAEPLDVVAHVRGIEEVLIETSAALGLPTRRVSGRSGVWTTEAAERKVAAIGVRVARGGTLHGFAVNADCDLAAFAAIVPCGIRDAGVTTLSAALGRRVGIRDVARTLLDRLGLDAPEGLA